MSGVRSALIVATYEYDDPGLGELRAPAQDADALAGVLSDPEIGGFEVETVVNQPSHGISLAVARFFRNRKPDDVLLLHFSCHGLKDDSGELYFAARDTGIDLLEATAVPSGFVSRAMDRSRAGRVVLMLDCCYSGAFARGMTPRAAGPVDVNERLGGRGRAVITASSALQFAFEGNRLADGDKEAITPSVFTSALVKGLETGEADRDLDGWVSLDELYAYVFDEVTRVNPDQTPKKWTFDVEGDLYVARRSHPVSTPSELPDDLREGMRSRATWQRKAVVEPLTALLTGDHPGLALAARLALEELAVDDSDAVKMASRAALVRAGYVPPPEPDVDAEPVEPQGAPPKDRVEDRAAEPVPFRPPVDRERPRHVPPAEPADTAPQEPVDTTPPGGPDQPVPVVPPEGPWWRRALREHRILTGVAAAVVLVLAGALLLSPQGDDGGGDGGSGDGSAETVPDSEILLTQGSGAESKVVAYHVDSEQIDVADAEADVFLPTVSPDRKWVTYLKGTPSEGLVGHVVRADGADDRPIVSDEDRADCPFTGRAAWNSESTQVAFVCWTADHTRTGIFVSNLGDPAVMTRLLESDKAGSPTWRGDRVVYSLEGETESDPATLWEVSTTEPPHQLTNGDEGWDTAPTAYGDQVLFRRAPGPGTPGDAWLLDADGSEQQLTTDVNVTYPAWSPDGQTIAWLTPQGGRGQLWTMPLDGTPTQEEIEGKLGPPGWH